MVTKDPKFLICTNIGNSALIIERWWNGILNLNYPKEKIYIHLIEDQTTDGTLQYLQYIEKRYGPMYSSFKLDKATDLPMYSGMKIHPTMRWNYRADEWLGWHNHILFPYAKDDIVDHVTFIHGDVVAHPETLNRHVEIFKDNSNCGWVGSIGMKRGGGMINAWQWEVPNPVQQYNDCVAAGDGTNPKFVKMCRVMNYGEEARMPEVFDCAFVGSCYTLRGKILKRGITMKRWPQEAAIPFVIDMMKVGFQSMCDKLTPMTHMNYNGTEEVYKVPEAP